jgi:hypothetical protein
VGLTTYLLHVPIVLKSGRFNLLETSGLVQACNGLALPLLQYVLRQLDEIKSICVVRTNLK